MTLGRTLIARLAKIRPARAEQPDLFDQRLKALADKAGAQHRQARGVFKNRQSHQAA